VRYFYLLWKSTAARVTSFENPSAACADRKEYGGLKTDQARRMEDLEKENLCRRCGAAMAGCPALLTGVIGCMEWPRQDLGSNCISRPGGLKSARGKARPGAITYRSHCSCNNSNYAEHEGPQRQTESHSNGNAGARGRALWQAGCGEVCFWCS
jgi:hypothetical protein